jgi:hypothetical protein
MEERGKAMDSKPVQHTAEVIRAHTDLMEDKDIVQRFERISKYLDEIQGRSQHDFSQTNRRIQALRPLLRLSLRSDDFRKTFLSCLKIMKHIFEENVPEGSFESVLETGRQVGSGEAVQQANQVGQNAWDRMRSKDRILSEDDWNQLRGDLDKVFMTLHSHESYRHALHELFELPETLKKETKPQLKSGPAEKLKEESKGLIAQFSGREILDELFERMENLRVSLENNERAQAWWRDFRSMVEKIGKSYSGEQDLEGFRQHFDRSFSIYDSYRPEINKIISLIQEIFDNMANDEYVRDLQERVATIADDLYYVDSEGKKRLDTQAVGDISAALGESLRKQLEHFELPVLQGESESGNQTYRFWNLGLNMEIPQKIDIHMESDTSFDTGRSKDEPKLSTEMNLSTTIKGIRLEARNASFDYRSPMLNESGILDFTVPSIDLWIDFVYSPKKSSPSMGMPDIKSFFTFLRLRSDVSVSDIHITYHKQTLNHDIVVPMLTKIFKPWLISHLEDTIKSTLTKSLEEVGRNMEKLFQHTPYLYSPEFSNWKWPMGRGVDSPKVPMSEEKKQFMGSPKVERLFQRTYIH